MLQKCTGLHKFANIIVIKIITSKSIKKTVSSMNTLFLYVHKSQSVIATRRRVRRTTKAIVWPTWWRLTLGCWRIQFTHIRHRAKCLQLCNLCAPVPAYIIIIPIIPRTHTPLLTQSACNRNNSVVKIPTKRQIRKHIKTVIAQRTAWT